MKDLPLVLRLGSGVLTLSLFLLPPVARAEDTAAPNQAKEAVQKSDANGNGQRDDSEKAKLKADEAARAEKYRQDLAKYDANHNGVLDPDELAKMKNDELAAAKTENQAAKDDARFQRKLEKLREGKKIPDATKPRKH